MIFSDESYLQLTVSFWKNLIQSALADCYRLIAVRFIPKSEISGGRVISSHSPISKGRAGGFSCIPVISPDRGINLSE
jgi:hypothetical protein